MGRSCLSFPLSGLMADCISAFSGMVAGALAKVQLHSMVQMPAWDMGGFKPVQDQAQMKSHTFWSLSPAKAEHASARRSMHHQGKNIKFLPFSHYQGFTARSDLLSLFITWVWYVSFNKHFSPSKKVHLILLSIHWEEQNCFKLHLIHIFIPTDRKHCDFVTITHLFPEDYLLKHMSVASCPVQDDPWPAHVPPEHTSTRNSYQLPLRKPAKIRGWRWKWNASPAPISCHLCHSSGNAFSRGQRHLSFAKHVIHCNFLPSLRECNITVYSFSAPQNTVVSQTH